MQSESPDEEALVKAAAEFGWTFLAREQQDPEASAGTGSRTVVTLKRTHEGSDHALVFFELLATIPFTSDRKRMSVIVRRRALSSAASHRKRDTNTNRAAEEEIVLYCKGADNLVLDRSGAYRGRSF